MSGKQKQKEKKETKTFKFGTNDVRYQELIGNELAFVTRQESEEGGVLEKFYEVTPRFKHRKYRTEIKFPIQGKTNNPSAYCIFSQSRKDDAILKIAKNHTVKYKLIYYLLYMLKTIFLASLVVCAFAFIIGSTSSIIRFVPLNVPPAGVIATLIAASIVYVAIITGFVIFLVYYLNTTIKQLSAKLFKHYIEVDFKKTNIYYI